MKKDNPITYTKYNYLSEDDIRNILLESKSNFIHYILIGLFYSSGLTLQELLKIKVKHINLDNMVIKYLRDKKRQSSYTSIPRDFHNSLINLIYKKNPDDYLFGFKNKPLNIRTVQKIFVKLGDKVGKKISSYIFRRSLAIHLYKNGWNERSISVFLGHSQFQSTKKMLQGIDPFPDKQHPIDNMRLNAA